MQVGAIAEKIRAKLAQSYQLKITHPVKPDVTVEHHCTASIGIAMSMNQEVSQDDIVKHADAAMYQAKDSGRNAIRFYEAVDQS